MVKTVFSIRHARPGDAEAIAAVHDASWRDAYRGVIPGGELERMIARRGPRWWHSAIVKGTGLLVLDFDKAIAGYATYGRNRVPSMPYLVRFLKYILCQNIRVSVLAEICSRRRGVNWRNMAICRPSSGRLPIMTRRSPFTGVSAVCQFGGRKSGLVPICKSCRVWFCLRACRLNFSRIPGALNASRRYSDRR